MIGELLNPAVVWVLIPIAAIVSGFLIKWKKLELQHGQNQLADEQVQELETEITTLRRRIESLEAIAAGEDGKINPPVTTDTSYEEPDSSAKMKNMLRSS